MFKFVDLATAGCWLAMAVRQLEIMQACYQYTGEGQAQNLPFEPGALITVTERADTGWFRGVTNQRQGWFPASYVQPVSVRKEETNKGR